MLSVIILIIVAYKDASPEKKDVKHLHGTGQVDLSGALALFGVDYSTSYYYSVGLSLC